MLISSIISAINTRLAGETLSLPELITYLDTSIDNINTELDSCFPVFSELPTGTTEYTAIPDKYIRTVVVPGVAAKYYATDEEGILSAPEYKEEFQAGLYYMKRDFSSLIPEEYRAPDGQGYVSFQNGHPILEGGLYVDGSCFIL